MKYEVGTQSIDIKTQDGNCDCFIARPAEGKFPAVLLLMDAYGPRDYLYEMARELASNGYCVLLPNLFYRQKRAPVVNAKFPVAAEDLPQARSEIMALLQNHNIEDNVRDMSVLLSYLSEQKNVIAPYGVTGYCMGGGLAIRTAAEYPDKIAAAASFHAGRLATDQPNSPHLLLPKIKAEIYVAHADNDQSMPAEQIEVFNQALEQSHIKAKAELYTGAAHGFTMMDLPAGNKEALARHWQNLLDLFERCL